MANKHNISPTCSITLTGTQPSPPPELPEHYHKHNQTIHAPPFAPPPRSFSFTSQQHKHHHRQQLVTTQQQAEPTTTKPPPTSNKLPRTSLLESNLDRGRVKGGREGSKDGPMEARVVEVQIWWWWW